MQKRPHIWGTRHSLDIQTPNHGAHTISRSGQPDNTTAAKTPITGTDAAQPGPQTHPSAAADSSATPPRHPEGAPPVHHCHRRQHTPPRERAILLGQTTSSKRPPSLPRRKPVKWDLKINMMNETANQALQFPTHPLYRKRTANVSDDLIISSSSDSSL